jgi:hypothetical protein
MNQKPTPTKEPYWTLENCRKTAEAFKAKRKSMEADAEPESKETFWTLENCKKTAVKSRG